MAVEKQRKNWGSYAAIHLRFLPYDDKHTFTPQSFADIILKKHAAVLQQVSYLYVAYSGTCEKSVGIVKELQSRADIKLRTADQYLSNIGKVQINLLKT